MLLNKKNKKNKSLAHPSFEREWIVFLIIYFTILITPIFIEDSISGLFHIGLIRVVLAFGFIFYFLIYRFINSNMLKYPLLFLIYCGVLVLISDRFFISLHGYSRTIISIMMLPIGYFYINSFLRLKQAMTATFLGAAIISAYLIYTNIFGIGVSHYLEDSFYTGNLSVAATKLLGLVFLLGPLYYVVSQKWPKWIVVVLLISIVFVLMGLKRSALLGVISGIVVYIVLTPKKTWAIRVAGIGVLILAIGSSLFWETFLQRKDARQRSIDSMIEIEQTYEARADRLGEFIIIAEISAQSGLPNFLFGQNAFDHIGVIPTWRRNRPLHVDYSIYLYGTGILGLLGFLYLYYVPYKEKRKYTHLTNKIPICKELNAVFYALITMGLIFSIAGSWGDIGLRSTLLLYLGGIVSLTKSIYKTNYNQIIGIENDNPPL